MNYSQHAIGNSTSSPEARFYQEAVQLESLNMTSAVCFVQPMDIFLPDQFFSGSTEAKASTLVAEFEKHKRKWMKETQYVSSPSEKYLHSSYARIIGFGLPVVKLILLSLQTDPADWFYALRAITGSNPVTDTMAGDLALMSEAWLKWGKKAGLI